jgi:hypothetical protein
VVRDMQLPLFVVTSHTQRVTDCWSASELCVRVCQRAREWRRAGLCVFVCPPGCLGACLRLPLYCCFSEEVQHVFRSPVSLCLLSSWERVAGRRAPRLDDVTGVCAGRCEPRET